MIFVGLLGILAAGIWYEINEGALEFASGNQTQPLLTPLQWGNISTSLKYTKRKLIKSYVSLTVAQLIGYARNRYMHVSTAHDGSKPGQSAALCEERSLLPFTSVKKVPCYILTR